MKIRVLFLMLVCVAMSRAEDITLGDTQSLHQNERYVWLIPAERIAKLPVWMKDKPLPLSPQQAESIAYAWSRRQTLGGFIPDRPYQISLVQFGVPFEDRYFYKVHFTSKDGRDSFWTVHVLMDGTIVEPTKK